jgi:hypothetical protein
MIPACATRTPFLADCLAVARSSRLVLAAAVVMIAAGIPAVSELFLLVAAALLPLFLRIGGLGDTLLVVCRLAVRCTPASGVAAMIGGSTAILRLGWRRASRFALFCFAWIAVQVLAIAIWVVLMGDVPLV